MKKELNLLERTIVNEIAYHNKKRFPFIKDHIPYLKVKCRQRTGVGMYVNFEYIDESEQLADLDQSNIALSSDKSLELNTLKYSLNYELNFTNGRIDFLELVTNGEPWDGDFESFKLLK